MKSGPLSGARGELLAEIQNIKMKAYCINLDRRQDRRDHMWAQFERLGVDVARIAAFDGNLPEFAEQTKGLAPGVNGLRLGSGAFACFQSHRLCWLKLIESGSPHAMVLEDDLVIAEGFGRYLSDDWVPADSDIVKLETRTVRVLLDREVIPVDPGHYLSRLRSSHFGGGGYVISAKAADRLYRLTETVIDAVDEVIFDMRHEVFHTLAIYQMVPGPVIQGDIRPLGSADHTWSKTSMLNRFGPGETADEGKLSLPRRIVRRLKAEGRALFEGKRYVIVEHG